MKFRFPSLSEFFGMFFTPTKVGHIVASIDRQVASLETVAAHQFGKAEKHAAAIAAALNAAAVASDAKAAAAEEAARALRVAGKLSALAA